jgi:hypothetical protein
LSFFFSFNNRSLEVFAQAFEILSDRVGEACPSDIASPVENRSHSWVNFLAIYQVILRFEKENLFAWMRYKKAALQNQRMNGYTQSPYLPPKSPKARGL